MFKQTTSISGLNILEMYQNLKCVVLRLFHQWHCEKIFLNALNYHWEKQLLFCKKYLTFSFYLLVEIEEQQIRVSQIALTIYELKPEPQLCDRNISIHYYQNGFLPEKKTNPSWSSVFFSFFFFSLNTFPHKFSQIHIFDFSSFCKTENWLMFQSLLI